MTQPIWYDDSETGAPVVNNVAGSALAAIRACLVNGFNTKTITSIVVASGVATVNCTAHGYSASYGKLVLIAGSSEALLNGNKQPGDVLTNSFTYPAPGVADGTYNTGSITAKRAPLGWTEPHTGTNKAIFARSAVEALAQMIRLVDDNAVAGIVRATGVVSATDVDTFTGDFPSAAQISGGAYWQKGANTATAKKWFVVGNDRAFYFGSQLGTADEFVVYFFGDGVPYYAGDAGFTLLSGQTGATYSATPGWALNNGKSLAVAPASGDAMYAPTGVLPGESSAAYQATANPSGSLNVSGYSLFPSAVTYTNPVIHPLVHVISTGSCVRGQMPGLSYILAAKPFANLQVVDASADKFLAASTNNSGTSGQLAIKLNGEWY